MAKCKYREIAKFLERQIKERGLRVENIACKGLSASTIRRILRGEISLKEEKIRLLCHQLGYQLEEVAQLLGHEDLTKIKERLDEIDLDIELRIDLRQSIAELDDVAENMSTNHLYMQVIHYLKAKAFFYSGQKWYDEAEKEALHALDVANIHQGNKMNIASCALNLLSNIYYKTKGVKSAYDTIIRSIDQFDLEGENIGRYYMALVNKASYLEKMDRLRDAEEILEYLIGNISNMTHELTKVTVHELYAQVKRQQKQFDDALRFARKGLAIACMNQFHDRAFELWAVIGQTHEDLGQLDSAQNAFQRALRLENHIKQKSLLLSVYTHLGNLHRRKHEVIQSKHYFEMALKMEVDDTRYIDTLEGYARLCIETDQPSQAIEPLKKAMRLAATQGIKSKEQDICLLLAECLEFIDQDQFLKYQHLFYRISVEAKKEA
jgi:tetratricopeptide (TPR) repeat protein